MAFATTEDVAARLGRGELTAVQEEQAEILLDAATAVIAAAVDKTDAWAAALTPVPNIVRFMCIELAVRVLANPDAVRSFSEQLGAHQYSASFRDTGGGMLLSPIEERLLRRAVFGTNSASATLESVVDDVYGS